MSAGGDNPAHDWEQWERTRRDAGTLAILFFVFAVVSGVANFFTTTNIRVLPVIFVLLGSHAMTAWLLCGHVVKLSSALFMKRQALNLDTPGVRHVMAGDVVEVASSDGTRTKLEFHTSSKFRVIR